MSTKLVHPGLLIASRAWLCTREEFRGRSGCGDTLTRIFVAAALLGEQLLLETMAIEGGKVVVFNENMPYYGDLAARDVLRRVMSERLTLPQQPGPRHLRPPAGPVPRSDSELSADVQACRKDTVVRKTLNNIRMARDVTTTQEWLEVLSDDAHELVADRLTTWGVLTRVSRGWIRPREDYELVDIDDVATASGTLSTHVANRRPHIPQGDALLLGLIKASKLDRHVLGPSAADAADYVLGQVARLGSWERALIAETEMFATNKTQI